MPEPGTALHDGAAAAKDALEDVLNIVFEWVVPIITLLVGFYVGSGIGLSGSLYSILDGIIPKTVTQTTLAWVADLVAIAIYAAIGAALWHASGGAAKVEGKANIRKWVLRPLSTLFFGFAGSEAGQLMKGGVSSGGMLSSAASKMAAGAPKGS